MNEIPPSVEADGSDPLAAESTRPKGALSERHHKYAEEFKQWLLGLNRADFAQARRVLEAMTKAYFKHTIKVHSPPMRDANNDDSGKTSDGQADPVLPDGPATA